MIQKFIKSPTLVTSESHRMLRALTLDQSVTVPVLAIIQFTSPINVLGYDYSYLVVNIGSNPAVAFLQISPNGTAWETQSDTKTINAGTLVSFVPDVIAKFARLAYQVPLGSPNTTVQIYTQGVSYN